MVLIHLLLLGTLATLGLRAPATAQAFSFPDGVAYQPALHKIVLSDVPPSPFALGALRPGLHIDSVYHALDGRRGYHSCFYETDELRASCFFRPGPSFEPLLSRGTEIRADVDRRTGSLLTVEIVPAGHGNNRRGEESDYSTVLSQLRQTWGSPADTSGSCVRWQTTDSSAADDPFGVLCRDGDSGWVVRSLDPRVFFALRDHRMLEAPERSRGEQRVWTPVWRPLSFAGIHAGMDAREVLRRLGGQLGQCETRGDLTKPTRTCKLAGTDLTLAGAPVQVELSIGEDGRAGFVIFATEWTRNETLANHLLREATSDLIDHLGEPTKRLDSRVEWEQDPFRAGVIRNWDSDDGGWGDAPVRYRVAITLSVLGIREGPANR